MKSIPLFHRKNEILSAEATNYIPENLFTKPGKLHITFGVMQLKDDDDKLAASHLLDECINKSIM